MVKLMETNIIIKAKFYLYIYIFYFISITFFSFNAYSSIFCCAEYFIDFDPGEGNAMTLQPQSLDTKWDFDFNIDTSNLGVGIHKIFIRLKGLDGKWGPTRQYSFEVTEEATIKVAEYYIDTDTFLDPGNPLIPVDGYLDQRTELLTSEIETINLSSGDHKLYIKLIDSYSRVTISDKIIFNVFQGNMIKGVISTGITGSIVPVSEATIIIPEIRLTATSKSDGSFIFTFSEMNFEKLSLQIDKIGFQSLILHDIVINEPIITLPSIQLSTVLAEDYNLLTDKYSKLVDEFNNLSNTFMLYKNHNEILLEQCNELKTFNTFFDVNQDIQVNVSEVINLLKFLSDVK